MKTYEEFLDYLKTFLNDFSTYVPLADRDFSAIAFATVRFLIIDQYRWQDVLAKWPELPAVDLPADNLVIEFFNQHKGLLLSFRKEIAARQMDVLKKSYAVLFPMLVLKHEYIAAIFRHEIKTRRFKAILRDYDERLQIIGKKIHTLKENPKFLRSMKHFTDHLVGYSLTLLQNKKLLDEALASVVKKS